MNHSTAQAGRIGVKLKKVYYLFRNMLKRFLLGLIKFYRKYFSGLKRNNQCRYIPTCSQYAMEALEKYGPFKGSFLAVKRILRCNPFSKGGYDPVP